MSSARRLRLAKKGDNAHRLTSSPSYSRVVVALERFGSIPVSNGKWQCPAHDDLKPSLSVGLGSKGVLIKCHAGCRTEDVVSALGLGMRDLFDGSASRAASSPAAKIRPKPWSIPESDIEVRHVYRRAGEIQFEVCRIWPAVRARYGGSKCFPRHRDEYGRWCFGQGPRWRGRLDKPLYCEDEAIDELRLGGKVFVVEGERDADALWAVGCVAVCNPDGAGSFRPAQAQRLTEAVFISGPVLIEGQVIHDVDVLQASDAEIMVVADRDTAGRRHAIGIRNLLIEADPRIKDHLKVRTTPEGCKDVAEWRAEVAS